MNRQGKIKVIRIIARLNIGGPAIHTILLAAGLDKERFESFLICGSLDKGEEDMSYLAEEKSVKPVFIKELQRKINPLSDLIAFVKIFRVIAKEKPQIIHTHTAKAGTLGRIAGIFYNLSHPKDKAIIIHTFHGTVLSGYFNRIESGFFLLVERAIARFTDWIVVLSKTLENQILELKIGEARKLAVIPLGLDLDKFLNLTLPVSGGKIKIGIVGRLVPIKNHRLFLDAVKLFLSNSGVSGEYEFMVIGDGELRQELEDYTRSLGVASSVKFYGWQKQLAKIYDSLDIVALTSLNEGTPVSLIEAMAAALPVIATETGGVGDLFIGSPASPSTDIKIFDNGILCKSGDAQGIARAFALLSQDAGLRNKMGERGRDFVKNKFSKERLIKDMELLYNTTLSKE